ncbi:MAG TPA: S8 family serine peptidase [Thermoanaerobaculia bacterium]|nr:S8 family serine peptidase [Thermoanaerobaculia bacterium]
MTRPRTRQWRRLTAGAPALAALALLLLSAGCASAPAGGGAPSTAHAAVAEGAVDTSGQVLVLLEPGPVMLWQRKSGELAAEYRLQQVAAWTVGSLDDTPCVIYQAAPGADVRQVLRRLEADPRVSVAQPVQRFRVLAAPPPQGQAPSKSGYNDPYADLQRDVTELSLPAVHRVATGKGVKVGVVDTGLDVDHPDLRGRVAGIANYVESGERSFTSDVHGTAVAGILAAASNNQVGIVGVAPEALLYAFKACWQEPPASRQAVCDSYTLARAVDAALGQGVQVLNLSLSGPPDPFLSRLLGAAIAKRTVVVAAYDGAQADGGFPASRDGVLSVGAEARAGDPRGVVGKPPLVGPAVDVLSTAPRASYDFFNGSSFAAAHVAGVAALLLERKPSLTAAEVRDLLVGSGRRDGDAPPRVDPCAALGKLEGHAVCAASD